MKEQVTQAQVEEISPLTDSILRLVLKPEKYIEYEAGQYLQILLHEEALSYSIANAPLGSHTYELHIRHSRDNSTIQSLLTHIREKGTVDISLPLGHCHLKRLSPKKPILFIAGGTGFAPIKAMIEQLLATSDERMFELYWGARSQNDLYLDNQVHHWQTHVSRFQYFSLLSEASRESLASLVLTRHQEDLNRWQIIISGPFDLVYSTRDLLVSKGVSADNLFSDAFDLEK